MLLRKRSKATRRKRALKRSRKTRGGAQPSDKAMVIVEPREHKDLKRVLENFDKNMDKSWDLYVFHGKSRKNFAAAAAANISGRTVNLIPLDTDNLISDEYNVLFKDPAFWNKIAAENIMIFQTDAALCGKSAKKIESFMKYKYIGCSYNDSQVGDGPWPGNKYYGVGGLSFRKKSFVLSCIAKSKSGNSSGEDMMLANCLHEEAEKPETGKVINEFCTQNEYHNPSFGAHKTRLYLRENDKPSFYTYCPEAKGL